MPHQTGQTSRPNQLTTVAENNHLRVMLAILLALPACSPEQSAHRERVKAWTADQERRTDQITAELAALRNAMERPPTVQAAPLARYEITTISQPNGARAFKLDNQTGESWMYIEPKDKPACWVRLVDYELVAANQTTTEPPPPHKRNEHGWIGLEPITSPTNQPHATR